MNAGPEAKKKTQSARRLLYLCVAGVTAFIMWAFVGVLAVVSISPGEVIPASQVKTVQHLEGGIVREIAVKEGDQVRVPPITRNTSLPVDISTSGVQWLAEHVLYEDSKILVFGCEGATDKQIYEKLIKIGEQII